MDHHDQFYDDNQDAHQSKSSKDPQQPKQSKPPSQSGAHTSNAPARDDNKEEQKKSKQLESESESDESQAGTSHKPKKPKGKMTVHEAGLMGASKRWGKDYLSEEEAQSSAESDGNESENESGAQTDASDRSQGSKKKHKGEMTVHEAGLRGASKRWGKDYVSEEENQIEAETQEKKSKRRLKEAGEQRGRTRSRSGSRERTGKGPGGRKMTPHERGKLGASVRYGK